MSELLTDHQEEFLRFTYGEEVAREIGDRAEENRRTHGDAAHPLHGFSFAAVDWCVREILKLRGQVDPDKVAEVMRRDVQASLRRLEEKVAVGRGQKVDEAVQAARDEERASIVRYLRRVRLDETQARTIGMCAEWIEKKLDEKTASARP
jgi:hypothetical protein